MLKVSSLIGEITAHKHAMKMCNFYNLAFFFLWIELQCCFYCRKFSSFFLWHRQIKMSELLIIMVENLTFFLNLCTAISINDDYIGVAPVNVYCLHFTSNKILLLLAFFFTIYFILYEFAFLWTLSVQLVFLLKRSREIKFFFILII